MQLVDGKKLRFLIETLIKVPEGESHSKVQEFARRMDYRNWKTPSFIYDVLNGHRKEVAEEWLERAAIALNTQPYYLMTGSIIQKVFDGLLHEVNASESPVEVVANLFEGRADSIGEEENFADSISEISHLSQTTFSYLIEDTALEPIVKKGSILTVDSKPLRVQDLESGRMYYFEISGSGSIVRVVFRQNEMITLLAADSNKYPPLTLAESQLKSIHGLLTLKFV